MREALGLPGDGGGGGFSTISTDTRTVTPGALFVALSGERFDAHDFLPAAAAIWFVLVGDNHADPTGPRLARCPAVAEVPNPPGDFAGEIALLTNAPRTATIRTTSPATVLRVTSKGFAELLKTSPSIQRKIQKALADRVAATAL